MDVGIRGIATTMAVVEVHFRLLRSVRSGKDAFAMRESLSRTAVVDAARELLMSEGVSGLSLRRLAARLDVTAAALYAYVDNKRDLVDAVIETEFARLIHDFSRHEDGDPIARVCHLCWAYLRHAQENAKVFRSMFSIRAELAAEPDNDAFSIATRAFGAARKPLGDAIEQGLVRSQDPALAYLTLWTTVHGAATVLLLGPDLGAAGAEDLCRSVIRTVVRGLCTERGLALLAEVELPPTSTAEVA